MGMGGRRLIHPRVLAAHPPQMSPEDGPPAGGPGMPPLAGPRRFEHIMPIMTTDSPAYPPALQLDFRAVPLRGT